MKMVAKSGALLFICLVLASATAAAPLPELDAGVSALLARAGMLAEHGVALAEQRITAAHLPQLTKPDLKDLGITRIGDQLTLLSTIAQTKLPRAPAAPKHHQCPCCDECTAELLRVPGMADALARACASDDAHLYASTCAAHYETKAPPEPEPEAPPPEPAQFAWVKLPASAPTAFRFGLGLWFRVMVRVMSGIITTTLYCPY